MMNLLYIDLFAGAGGVTTGVENARLNGAKVAKVIAAVNHDPIAIASHSANHPETHHFIEDIKTLDVSKLVAIANGAKRENPEAKLVLWASLECTNFSNAKGGLPRDADSRTLANHLFRYIEALNPDYIQIENVREFMSWGPLDDNGKPVSRLEGQDYIRWVNRVKVYGYDFNWRLLNAADFGAYTSRVRYFAQFAKQDLPITWPETTHSKDVSGTLFNTLKPWKPVKDVLDLNDEGESIFNRNKDLSDKTLERIHAGLVKYVANGKKEFLSKYFSGKPMHKNISIDGPSGALKTKDSHALVKCFISQYYGNGGNSSIDRPSPTLTTKDRLSLIWIDKQYSGPHNHQNANSPMGTLTTIPKASLMKAFILNPSWGGHNGNIDSPCCVIVARQDKAPLYLVAVEEGNIAIPVYESDTEAMIKIKEFMALYGIIDIKMRMLRVKELKLITGFPESYVLKGNQNDQKKSIGNAVPCIVPRRMVESLSRKIIETKLKVA
jgi:DNA (cytosine-5)-methyltransferase 1